MCEVLYNHWRICCRNKRVKTWDPEKKKKGFMQRICKKKKRPDGKTAGLESKQPTLNQEDESDGFSQTQ